MEPMLISIADAARALNLGKTSIYALVSEGRLETAKGSR